ncbi:MAG: hypothetical protein Q9165_000851 [Trypethelium subeluteriae]
MPRRTSCFVHSLLRAQEKKEIHHGADTTTESPADKAPDLVPEDEHSVQSRLLTKTQLSDMAFNIRELSKKLSHITVKLKVRRVFLLTKAHDSTLIQHTREVAQWLLSKEREESYTVYVENTLEHNKQFDVQGLLKLDPSYEQRLKFWDNELCKHHPHRFDIVLALGGDGTVLYASWLFQKIVPPVIPFALGSLGFLTRFDFDNYPQTLTKAFHNGITVSLRLRFEVTVMRAQGNLDADSRDLIEELIGEEADDAHTHKPEISHDILNDLVIDRGPNPNYVTISASRFPFPSVLPLERQREDWIQAISRTLNWNSRQRQKSFKD